LDEADRARRLEWNAMADSVLRVNVDSALVERATAEVETALAAQNVAYAERFERRWLSRSKQRVLRSLALVLCALGAGLSVFLIASAPAGCSAAALGKIFFAAFGIVALAFYRIVDIQAWLLAHTRRFAGGRLRAYAARNLAAMRSAVPLVIEYTLADASISGRWIRDDYTDTSWQRELGSFAYVGAHVGAIFRDRRATYPTVLLLHTDSASVVRALEAHGVETAALPREIPTDYGLSTV